MLNKMKKTRAGFTLVELIVVIAILAILAGVAIPVYSSYINRANKAADLTLLGAANAAFAAACLQHGFDHTDVSIATFAGTNTISGIKSITLKSGVTPLIALSANDQGYSAATLSAGHHAAELAVGEEFSKTFLSFFGDNKDTALQFYESVNVFVFKDGMFMESGVKGMSTSRDESTGTTTMTVTMENGKTATYTVTDSQVAAVNTSTYGSEMTVTDLVGDVGGMVDSLANVLGGGTAVAGMLQNFGIDLEALGITPPFDNDADKAALSNAVVLAVAKGFTYNGTDEEGNPIQIDAAQSGAYFAGVLGSKEGLTGLTTMLEDANIGAMMQADNLGAMVALYAVATGFSSSNASEGLVITDGDGNTYNSAQAYYEHINNEIASVASDPNLDSGAKGYAILDLMSGLKNMMLDSEGNFNDQYQQYIADGKLLNDTTGFVQAMQMIEMNSDGLVVSGAVSDGFNSGSISAIMEMLLHGNG